MEPDSPKIHAARHSTDNLATWIVTPQQKVPVGGHAAKQLRSMCAISCSSRHPRTRGPEDRRTGEFSSDTSNRIQP